ncbi:MAG: beta-propeller fold lactonase family protein [Ignavibacteriaceae bacterium]|nr:beta-propeller fold lactonase family protein [Ignavibacteriaceae bacterium]
MKKRFLYIVINAALLLPIFLTGCSEDPAPLADPIDANHNGFETRAVAEVFVLNCALSGCHAGASPKGGISFETYDKMIAGSDGRHTSDDTSGGHGHGKLSGIYTGGVYGGEAVVPYNPEESLVYRLITGNVEDSTLRMPYNKSALSESQILSIRNWILNGAKNHHGEVPFSNPSVRAYICSQGTDQIYVIDGDKKLVSRVMNLRTGTQIAPHNAKIFGDYYYVTQIRAGKLVKYRITDNSVAGELAGLEVPGMVELSADGTKAFVSKSSTATGSYNSIYVINTATMQLISELAIPVSGMPHGIALNSSATTLYVANLTKDRITVLNTVTGDPVIDDIVMSSGAGSVHEPMHIYVSPDDKYLYVTCRKSDKLLIYDADNGNLLKDMQFTSHPMQISIAPSGNRLYVNLMHSAEVAVVDFAGSDWAVSSLITHPNFTMLYGSALSNDGRYLFVTSSNDLNEYKPRYAVKGRLQSSNLGIIETATNQVVRILDLGAYTTGLAAR